VASQAKKAQSQFYDVEEILSLQLWYLVQREGYGHGDNTWEPGEILDPQVLWQFHVYRRRPATQVTPPRPAQLKMTEQAPENCFDVENILDVKVKYLVKWKGYGHKDNTWEPREHFPPLLLQQFHEENGPVEKWIMREIRDIKRACDGGVNPRRMAS
jgi:hypothetical protein